MKHYFEVKGTKEEINTAITLFVNSGCKVFWETVTVVKQKRKMLVIDDRKEKEAK